jgi:hypothetical protein
MRERGDRAIGDRRGAARAREAVVAVVAARGERQQRGKNAAPHGANDSKRAAIPWDNRGVDEGDEGDGQDAATSGALPTQADSPGGRRREPTQPGNVPSLSAFDPPRQRFELRGEIGRGGMGRVEDAFDRALGRQVAIKQLLSDSPVDLARFEREARITARLEHPSIVPVHDAGRNPDGTPYYVMRHVDGRPLHELVKTVGLAERLALVPSVLAVCDAVGYAHARGVVHRDIKPSNILVGPFGETLLIDWGLARETAAPDDDHPPSAALVGRSDPQLTQAGSVAGTPGFMAPEQARGEYVDARADVFALGATLFHVLAGRPPYAADSATAMIDAVGADLPPEWSRIPAGVPADLLAIVHKAMASDPAARYTDAGAMAADLRQFVTGKLVAAHAYGLVEQLRRFVRRHRGALAVGVIATIVVAVIAALSIRRVIDERDAAAAARDDAEARRRDMVELRDGLLVDHAKALAATDPVAAIALLRELPAESTRWPQAYAAAAQAFYRGVPSGFELEDTHITRIEASPDNLHASVTTIAGHVYILDLAGRTKRLVLTRDFNPLCDYVLGGMHLVCHGRAPALDLVDTVTGDVRTISLPGVVDELVTDGGARAWFSVGDRVYPVDLSHPDAPLASPLTFAHASDISLAYLRTAHRLLVHHDDVLEIVGDTEHWTIAKSPNSIQATDGAHVLLVVGEHLEIWDVSGAPELLSDRGPRGSRIPVALRGTTIYFLTGTGVVAAGGPDGRVYPEAASEAVVGSAPDSLFVAHTDGSIELADDDGSYELAPRASLVERIAVSSDHRYVLAASAHGVVTWWDLSQLRVHAMPAAESERPVALGKWLWTITDPTRVTRFDLAGRGFEIPVTPPTMNIDLPESERYFATHDPDDVRVFDATTGTLMYHHHAADLVHVIDDAGLTMVDGVDVSFVPNGSATAQHLATLPGPPVMLATQHAYTVALTATQACRIAPFVCIALPKGRTASSMAVDRDGATWFVADGKLYRWTLGGAAWDLVALEQSLTGLANVDGHALAYSPTSLTLLVPPMRPIPVTTVTQFSGAHGLVIYATTSQGASFADLDAGTTFDVQASGMFEQMFTNGEVLIGSPVRAKRNVMNGLQLVIPRERVALRAWLDTVTNARQTHGGLVSFPTE